MKLNTGTVTHAGFRHAGTLLTSAELNVGLTYSLATCSFLLSPAWLFAFKACMSSKSFQLCHSLQIDRNSDNCESVRHTSCMSTNLLRLYMFIWTLLKDMVSLSSQGTVKSKPSLTCTCCYIGRDINSRYRRQSLCPGFWNQASEAAGNLRETSQTLQWCVCIRLTLRLCALLGWDHRFPFFFFSPLRGRSWVMTSLSELAGSLRIMSL